MSKRADQVKQFADGVASLAARADAIVKTRADLDRADAEKKDKGYDYKVGAPEKDPKNGQNQGYEYKRFAEERDDSARADNNYKDFPSEYRDQMAAAERAAKRAEAAGNAKEASDYREVAEKHRKGLAAAGHS